MAAFRWKRFWQSGREIFAPIRGAWPVLGQISGWLVAFGLTGWAATTWTDVLPPNWKGKLLFGALFLVVICFAWAAVYRQLVKTETLGRTALTAARMPQEQRARIQRVKEVSCRLLAAMTSSSPDERSRAEGLIVEMRREAAPLYPFETLFKVCHYHADLAEMILKARAGGPEWAVAASHENTLKLREFLDVLLDVADLALIQHPE